MLRGRRKSWSDGYEWSGEDGDGGVEITALAMGRRRRRVGIRRVRIGRRRRAWTVVLSSSGCRGEPPGVVAKSTTNARGRERNSELSLSLSHTRLSSIAMPLFSSSLPPYRGPYAVSTTNVELPVPRASFGTALLAATHARALNLETVLFTLCTCAREIGRSHDSAHRPR